jgi:hypothetical protein
MGKEGKAGQNQHEECFHNNLCKWLK